MALEKVDQGAQGKFRSEWAGRAPLLQVREWSGPRVLDELSGVVPWALEDLEAVVSKSGMCPLLHKFTHKPHFPP